MVQFVIQSLKSMGQTYCTSFCGEGELAKQGDPILITEIDDEPNEKFAKKVKQHIEIHPRIKCIYMQQRTPHAAEKNGVELDLYYLYQFSAYYQGGWKHGLPNGFGRIIYDDGSIYEGCFNHGIAQCSKAFFIKFDGAYYKGTIKNNKANGEGELSAYKLHYKGNWKNDLPHGKAVQIYSNLSFYEGQFVNGIKEGFGTYQWNLTQYYKGMFRQNKIDGHGELKTKQYTYIGEFKNGIKEGEGKYVDNNQKYIFEGKFQSNQPKGQGTITYKDGTRFVGTFDGFSKRKGYLQFLSGQQFEINTDDPEQSSSLEIMEVSLSRHRQQRAGEDRIY